MMHEFESLRLYLVKGLHERLPDLFQAFEYLLNELRSREMNFLP